MTQLFKTKHSKERSNYFFFVDFATGSLGRCSSDAAKLLNGKFLDDFSTNIYYNVTLFVLNSEKLVLTGRKEEKNEWNKFKVKTLRTFKLDRNKNADWIIRHSISGMLSKNKLRKFKESKIIFLKSDETEDKIKQFRNFTSIKSDIVNFMCNKDMVKCAFMKKNIILN